MAKNSGFKELLNTMMNSRRWITYIILGGFVIILGAMFTAIWEQTEISGEWKELVLLLLGAFIGSYGKVIDYWFSDVDKDKMLVQKMDEEDGIALSNTTQMNSPKNNSESNQEVLIDSVEDTYVEKVEKIDPQNQTRRGVEIDEDGDGTMDGVDEDGDGIIDMYFEHRQCEHHWSDFENDEGEIECLKCGLIKPD